MHAIIMALLMLIFPPCVAEDSPNCVWDANVQGNGTGLSYVNIGYDDTYYVP